MAISEHLRELAKRYTAAWCSQIPCRVAACYSAGGYLTVNEGRPAAGRSAVAEVAEGFMKAFPDMQVHMDGLSAEEGHVVYRWTLTGTNTGLGGTGMPVRISGYEEWRISTDGLIAESLGHFDAEEYRRQIAHGKE
jgi:predicted ester cyclase